MRNRILPLLRQSPSGIDANPAFGLGLYTMIGLTHIIPIIGIRIVRNAYNNASSG